MCKLESLRQAYIAFSIAHAMYLAATMMMVAAHVIFAFLTSFFFLFISNI